MPEKIRSRVVLLLIASSNRVLERRALAGAVSPVSRYRSSEFPPYESTALHFYRTRFSSDASAKTVERERVRDLREEIERKQDRDESEEKIAGDPPPVNYVKAEREEETPFCDSIERFFLGFFFFKKKLVSTVKNSLFFIPARYEKLTLCIAFF